MMLTDQKAREVLGDPQHGRKSLRHLDDEDVKKIVLGHDARPEVPTCCWASDPDQRLPFFTMVYSLQGYHDILYPCGADGLPAPCEPSGPANSLVIGLRYRPSPGTPTSDGHSSSMSDYYSTSSGFGSEFGHSAHHQWSPSLDLHERVGTGLSTPLWYPSPVVGAVGYISKPDGESITLCNVTEIGGKKKVEGDVAKCMPSLRDYGSRVNVEKTLVQNDSSLYNTVKCSAELQYIVELGAQGLIEVHPRPPTVSLPECLRILRNKASMWNIFRLNALDSSRLTTLYNHNSIVHGNIFSFTSYIHVDAASDAVVCKIYSTRPAQIWMDENPVRHTYRHMVQLQNLEVIITYPVDVDTDGFKYQISFRTISGEEHPLSHGSRVVNGRAACKNATLITVAVDVLEGRLAVYVSGVQNLNINYREYWSLHVFNWQLEQYGQADDLCAIGHGYAFSDIRFLAKEKLIALSKDGQIHLYNIEDASKAPQLQAKFMLPVNDITFNGFYGGFDHPSIFHSATSCAGLAAPDDHWIWTKNPADRVISVTWTNPSSVFIISARIFFMDIPPTWFDVTSKDGRSVPWSSWGPQNSRLFPGDRFGEEGSGLFSIGGSRVIWAVQVADGNDSDSLFHLHMTDFNPSAVARSIDNVFSKPTTTSIGSDVQVTSYLPFVEVIHDLVCRGGSLWDIVLDEEKMAIVTRPPIGSGWKMQVDIFEP
ncbi:hypothetical protein DEU56DRAFT_933931 [Suillus clintonianus]|uniref:uncharacterized protein n=1 Tax=Suillus clintonianus TaxID=1904413 RepID=UPI001B86E2C4|nr:uncharacterized protein DEU56DRAFT_933931 [Suillus clintonianus]KAG2113958.1 hypothetical protein DEU56DRAFT_933931 [Suillus clintonianus]